MTEQNLQKEAMEYNDHQKKLWAQERIERLKEENQKFAKIVYVFALIIFFFGFWNFMYSLSGKTSVIIAVTVPCFAFSLMLLDVFWRSQLKSYTSEDETTKTTDTN